MSTQAITPQATGTTTDGWAYSTTTTSVTLTGYTGTSLTPAVPATVSGLPVTGVIVNAEAGAPAITSIDLSAAAGTLASLKIYGCALTSLDLSSCTKLAYVDLRANKLASLKLGSTTLLGTLFCSSNSLTALDASGCTSLVKLVCYSNSLTSLNVSKCSLLEYLDCHTNKLTGLTVDANLKLVDCFCYDNYISEGLNALTQRFGTEANVILPQNSVVKTDISSGTVAAITDQTYTGSALTPAVTLTVSGKTLVADTDYTVAYSNNTAVGTATVTITGIGSYTGTKTATFSIVSPPTPTPTLTTWKRLSGATALDTMSAIVDQGFSATDGTVVLATNNGYWDALTAAGVAGLVEAPVLLTDGESLSNQTKTELARLQPKTIIVCGGTSAITDAVATAAKNAAGASNLYRCAGQTATGTACQIYQNAQADTGVSFGETAIVATNDDYGDALSIAPYAYSKHCPIFLTEGASKLSSETLSTMKSGGITNVYIMGGTAAVSADVVSQLKSAGITVTARLAGDNAIETSQKIAEFEMKAGMSADNLGIATSDGYWDALTGAALCGKNGSVLLLINDSDRSAISGFIKPNASSISTGYVFGGTSAVSAETYNALVAATK